MTLDVEQRIVTNEQRSDILLAARGESRINFARVASRQHGNSKTQRLDSLFSMLFMRRGIRIIGIDQQNASDLRMSASTTLYEGRTRGVAVSM